MLEPRRMNQIIRAVNAGKPKFEINPPLQEGRESEYFDNLEKELADIRKKDPNANFWPVESEW